jgi:PAS domain S-box-containing protein
MRRRNRLAWKLSSVVLVVVSAVILGTGYFGRTVIRGHTLSAAREIMRFNSASIINGLDKLMMSGDNDRVLEFIGDMSRRSTTYQDMSLVSHPSGRICVSRMLTSDTFFDPKDRFCTQCHEITELPKGANEARDEIIVNADGSRILRVTTPILSKSTCRSADCHVHDDAGSVLGILKTDYSLASFDEFMAGLNLLRLGGAILAVLLATAAMLLMFRGFLAKPLRGLVTGIEMLTTGNLTYRFSAERDDEIGLVEESFNKMASRIREQQNALRNTLEHLQGLVENTADIVITVDRQDRVETFNRGAELILGYDRKEVTGRSVEMLLADARERQLAIDRLQGRDNVTNWETLFRTKDGKVRNVLLTLSRIRDRRGHLIGTLGIGKDITVEKDLILKLMRSEQEAAIGRAVTGIQHAIKNMLNSLRGGLYIVHVGQKKGNPEQIAEGCQMIDDGTTQISDLSQNMLKYAREWKIEPEPVDLAEMVGKIATGVSQTAREQSTTIRTDLADSMPVVSCDPRLIHLGLMDLVSNALDACILKEYGAHEQPEIVIRVDHSAEDEKAIIEVQDNGIGMAPEVGAYVFTPFFSTKKKWGTGLGLALTSRIIDLHEGQIVVESEPDKGTVFRITLPLETKIHQTGDA